MNQRATHEPPSKLGLLIVYLVAACMIFMSWKRRQREAALTPPVKAEATEN